MYTGTRLPGYSGRCLKLDIVPSSRITRNVPPTPLILMSCTGKNVLSFASNFFSVYAAGLFNISVRYL